MTGNPGKDQIIVNKLTEIVRANLGDENFGTDELSKATDLSHRKMRQILKSAQGKTINQFIRETRLMRALEMLENEDITASEVAYKTGFSSPTYFNTCFHTFFGFPPGEVKKRRLDSTDNEFYQEPQETVSTQDKATWKYKWTWKKKSAIYLSIFLIIVIIASGAYLLFSKNFPPVKKKVISIAVLPFKNFGNTPEDQYFIDGIIEEILTNLGRISDLRVISRTSVEQFRETILSASEIGKKLDVDYLMKQ